MPRICKCDLIWKKVFADVIKLRISSWDHARLSGWVLNPMTSVLIKGTQRRDTEKRRRQHEDRGRDWNAVATIEETPRKTGSQQKLEEAKKRIFSRASGGSVALPTPGFQNCGLQDYERRNLRVWSHQGCGDLLGKQQEINTPSFHFSLF